MKNVVVIGGGTGNFVVLSGIKRLGYNVSAIVCMMDSGGSTGRLRDQLGVLPPGDLRQCLVALSETTELWRKLFLYRFKEGDLKGHNFGNILLTALEKITKNYQDVVDTASYILKTRGKVLPVTLDKVNLCVRYNDGTIVEGEDLIDEGSQNKQDKIVEAFLKPKAKANPHAIEAIEQADYIIISPGDLYTSLIPNFIVDGIARTIKKSRGKIICIMNLMTKSGQTSGYSAADHLRDLEKYLQRKVDLILINNKSLLRQITDYYKKYGELEVRDDLQKDRRAIRYDLLASKIPSQQVYDSVKRSLLRHDSAKIKNCLKDLIG